MLRPTLLVGLGDSGAKIACGVATALRADSSGLGALVGGLVLTANGVASVRTQSDGCSASEQTVTHAATEVPEPVGPASDYAGGSPPVVDASSAEARAAAPQFATAEDAAVPPTPVSEDPGPARSSLNYAEAYAGHLDRRREIERLALREARYVRRHATVLAIEQGGGSVSELVHVLVFAPCFDTVGSTALPVALRVLDDLFREALGELPHEIQLVLMAPDLFEVAPADGDASYARTYACLQELEGLLEGVAGRPGIPVDAVWFYSGRSSADLFVSDGDGAVPLLIAHAVEVIRGAPAAEAASSPSTRQHVRGRVTRYSTYGQSRLHFPRAELLEAACALAVSRELESLPYLEPVKVPVRTAFAMVRQFARQHLENLSSRLSADLDGLPIFRPFDAAALNGTGPTLIRLLEERQAEYREIADLMQKALDARNQELTAAVRTAMGEQVQALARASTVGALAQAQAWLAAAGNDPLGHQHYIVGEADTSSEATIPAVIEQSWVEPLEEKFARFVFEQTSDLAREFLSAHPELRGSRRKLLREVQEDLPSRHRKLAERQLERRRLEDLLRAQSPPVAADTGLGDAEPEPRTESDPVARLQVRLMESALQAEEHEIQRLEIEIERLETLRREFEPQVKAMDEVLRDAKARRRLFQRLEDEDRQQAADLAQEYLERDQEHVAAVERLDAARFSLLAWSAVLGGLVLVVAVGAGYQARDVRISVGLSIVLLVVVARWIWLGPLSRYWTAKEAELSAREFCRAARAALLGHWDVVAQERFRESVCAVAAGWSEWVPREILRWNAELERLRAAITGAVDEGRTAAEWRPVPEAFTETLSPSGAVAALVEEHDFQLRSRFENYWQAHPFAEFIPAYLNGRVSPAELLQGLRAAAEEGFADIRGMSVEAYLGASLNPEEHRRVVDRVFRTAAPLARGIARPHDPATELVHVALADSPGRSIVLRTLTELGHPSVQHRQSSSETTVTLSRIATGYAAFQLAVLREAWGFFSDIPLEQRRAFYAEPSQADLLPDLFPDASPRPFHSMDPAPRRAVAMA